MGNISHIHRLAFAMFGAGIIGVCAAAAAPTDGDSLAEIVVTATKQAEPLSKVPISIAAFTAQEMDRQGVRSVEDIARLTPGLTFTSTSFGSGTSTDISIRGIKSDAGAATTGIYIDDVPVQIRANLQTAFGSSLPQVFDLERVEVLRGPQGTLFGAGAEGGAVRFITPAPSLTESSAYSRSEISSTEHGGLSYEAGVAGGAPIIDNVLGFRASAWYRHDGGYVDRSPYNSSEPATQTFSDVNSRGVTAFRGALAYQPQENLLITPAIYYQRQTTNDSGAFWGSLSNPADGQLTTGYAIRQPVTDDFTLPSLKIHLGLGSTEFTSISSYFDRKASAIEDYTNTDISFLSFLNQTVLGSTAVRQFAPFLPGQNAPGVVDAHQEIVSQEFRLNSTDPAARLRWTVGGFYSRALQDESFIISDQYAPLYFPVTAFFGEPLTDGKYMFIAYNHSVEKQLAAFGQVDLILSDRLSATLGLRYSKIDFEFDRTSAGPINYVPPGPDYQTTGGSQSARPVTPKFGLNFQADENNLAYVSIGKGFRTGGVNQPLFVGCTTLPVPTTFGPDSTWSYEVGSKNLLWGGAVRLEESVFLIKWRDIQEFVSPGGACAGNGFRDNLGEAESRGFDFQAEAKLNEHLTMRGAAGFVNATYTKTVVEANTIYARDGDTLGVTPWQFSGSMEYTYPLLGGQSYVSIQDQYGSRDTGRLALRDNSQAAGYDPTLTADPAVNVLDLRIGLRKFGVDASLFVDNLLDRQPLLSKEHDTMDSPLFYYHTIRPRTIGLTVTYRY